MVVTADVMELEFWILSFYPPGAGPVRAGVILFGPHRREVFVRIRSQWCRAVSAEDADILTGYQQMLVDFASDFGAAELARMLEDTLSNCVRIEYQGTIEHENARMALAQLYSEYVELV
jgi:hypothetical protein